ncbi:hypothetical protein F5Y07DRAFT_331045 [Xylaria sp. FL0933]|nr:hypothetical protein F5Y07DRAFT_331045 [Xylaria sp. FL0933]
MGQREPNKNDYNPCRHASDRQQTAAAEPPACRRTCSTTDNLTSHRWMATSLAGRGCSQPASTTSRQTYSWFSQQQQALEPVKNFSLPSQSCMYDISKSKTCTLNPKEGSLLSIFLNVSAHDDCSAVGSHTPSSPAYGFTFTRPFVEGPSHVKSDRQVEGLPAEAGSPGSSAYWLALPLALYLSLIVSLDYRSLDRLILLLSSNRSIGRVGRDMVLLLDRSTGWGRTNERTNEC